MIVGIPRESFPGERRVSMVPAVIPILAKAGIEVVVEAGAGAEAGFLDWTYTAKGARMLPDRAEVFRTADIIVQVLCHGSNDKTGKEDLPLLRPDQVLIGFLRPLGSLETIREIAERGVTAFAVELMPGRPAQSMDALSSMATLSGYKAVVVAADLLPRIFPMMTTAAGTITPAAFSSLAPASPACRPLPRRGGWAPSPRPTTCGPPRKNRCKAWADGSSSSRSRPRTPRTPAVTGVPRMRRSISVSASYWERSSAKATS